MTESLLVRPGLCHAYDFQAALYLLKISVRHDALSRRLATERAEEMRELMGIYPLDECIPINELLVLIKSRLQQMDEIRPTQLTALEQNICWLANLLSFSEIECKLMAFCALSQNHPVLSETMESFSNASIDTYLRCVSCAIDADIHEVYSALSYSGRLIKNRLFQYNRSFIGQIAFPQLTEDVLGLLFQPFANYEELIYAFVEMAPKSVLAKSDFPHLQDHTRLLSLYLKQAIEQKLSGVNILIYGPPGTGKTEYVRWLAQYIGHPLYAVRTTDKDDLAISGIGRLTFYKFCQQFLSEATAFIMFDEVGEVFSANEHHQYQSSNRKDGSSSKSWLNHLLETNPVPAIWITNDIDNIDDAYLRRFDHSIHIEVPPASVRQKILQKYLGHCAVADSQLSKLAQHDKLMPAQIQTAAKVVQALPPVEHSATLDLLIQNGIRLLGQPPNIRTYQCSSKYYQLDYLNADQDLNALVTKFVTQRTITASMCLYGISGSGKSAFAYYLAQKMDRPLIARRASDILSAYLGETENHMARMFRQAQQENAILLLDEADSFLSERQHAQYAWQVTQVNEMLTQMEAFNGLFICSTNLMDSLDQASLRRFTLKIRFDVMTAAQAWQLFTAYVQSSSESLSSYQIELAKLKNLTPGDFANVNTEVMLLHDALSPDVFLAGLQQESCSKRQVFSSAIGFLSQ